VLIPRTLLVWLGLSADFLRATFSAPSAKGGLIFELLSSVLGAQSVHFTTLESLVGKLGALALLGGPGHTHQVAKVLHGLGRGLQVPLYCSASGWTVAG
jgi:hypothetical protein